MGRVPRHPAEDLGRRGERTECSRRLRRRPRALGRALGEQVAGCGRQEHRPDEVRAAALVLLRARLAVLVAADRHVLGAVVRGELAAAQRERRGRDREEARDELARRGRRRERRRLCSTTALPSIEASTRGRSIGSCALGQRALHLRQEREHLGEPRRAAQERVRHLGGAQALAARDHLQLAVGVRTAQAHARGPCTSTPFASAIPPSRTLSSLTAWSVAGARPAAARRRAGAPVADRLPVERDDGHDLADRRGRERLVGSRKASSANAPSRAGSSSSSKLRVTPGEHSGAGGGREQDSAGAPPDVRGRRSRARCRWPRRARRRRRRPRRPGARRGPGRSSST